MSELLKPDLAFISTRFAVVGSFDDLFTLLENRLLRVKRIKLVYVEEAELFVNLNDWERFGPTPPEWYEFGFPVDLV
jgi:hypothetical protein